MMTLLAAKTAREFRKTKKTIAGAQLGFDALNILQAVSQLYEQLRRYAEQVLLELARLQYKKACGMAYTITGKRGTRILDDNWLLEYCLSVYDPVTKYVWTNEVERKQARTAEAVIASAGVGKGLKITGKYRTPPPAAAAEHTTPNRTEMNKALDAAAKAWVRMNTQQADDLTDTATLQAYRDSGVEHVMWVTQKDEKVCTSCRSLNGMVFPIDQAPGKQHWHCRCYYAPVK